MPPAADVANFIRATFPSVWALELLCFLRKHGGAVVSHDAMVAGLRGSDLVVTQSISSLAAGGLVLVEPDGGARYAPANDAVAAMAAAAEEAYLKGPDAIRRMIVIAGKPGIAAFADSFRLRKD